MFNNKDKKDEQKETPEVDPAQAGSAQEAAQDPVAAKINEYREQMLRLRAEFDNTKKRLEKDKQDSIKFANEKLLIELLQAVDNFDRALLSLTEGHDSASVKKGLVLAQQELHKVLERHGVEPVKSLGAEFDPNLHEAVAVVPSADVKEGTIMDEVQRGYLLNGRLIRPSRVRISSNA